MTVHGIEGLLFETHNWGKSVAFWKALGYELEFETDHHSGRLRHPAGGPYVFIAERPSEQTLSVVPAVSVTSAREFVAPRGGTVTRRFRKEHWGVRQFLLADPDGRVLAVEAPLTEEPARKAKQHVGTKRRTQRSLASRARHG